MPELHEIVEVRVVGDHRLFLRFADGAEGEINLTYRLRFDGVFSPLRDPSYFAHVALNTDLGTIVWPSGADLCPDVLHSWLTGERMRAAEAAHLRA